MTLDVCIIAATAHFSGLKNWLPVLHVYGTLYAIVHVHVRVIFSLALRCHNVLIIVCHFVSFICRHAQEFSYHHTGLLLSIWNGVSSMATAQSS